MSARTGRGRATSTRAWHFQFKHSVYTGIAKGLWGTSATEHANKSRGILRYIREKLEIWNKKFHLHYALACANGGTSPAFQLHLNGISNYYNKKEKTQ